MMAALQSCCNSDVLVGGCGYRSDLSITYSKGVFFA